MLVDDPLQELSWNLFVSMDRMSSRGSSSDSKAVQVHTFGQNSAKPNPFEVLMQTL